MKFFSLGRQKPAEQSEVAEKDATIAGKDAELADLSAKLAASRMQEKESRVALSLAIRTGRRFRAAIDTAGDRFELSIGEAARRLTGQ